jgi:hypothetical protein
MAAKNEIEERAKKIKDFRNKLNNGGFDHISSSSTSRKPPISSGEKSYKSPGQLGNSSNSLPPRSSLVNHPPTTASLINSNLQKNLVKAGLLDEPVYPDESDVTCMAKVEDGIFKLTPHGSEKRLKEQDSNRPGSRY